MISHIDIQRRLAAYCGGDLSPAEIKEVEQHLSRCPDCRAGLADLQTALRLVRTTPEVEPPPWLTTRIMANIREQQVKQGWLRRLFFPLHIKLPLEAIALLMICVSGYYLSRNLESDLKQSPGQQFQEGPAGQNLLPAQPPAQLPDSSEQGEQPAAARQPTILPPAAPRQPLQRQENLPAGTGPQIPARPAPLTYAPPPPGDRDQYGGKGESMKAAPAAESFDRAREAAPEMKLKDSRTIERQGDSSAPAAAGRAMMAPSPPRAVVILGVDDPAAARALIREAVLRSGGIIEAEPSSQRLLVRIAANRQKELLTRLELLGKIAERPLLPPGAELLELTIQW